MSQSHSISALGILPSGLLLACFMMSGCEKTDQITTYTVPKHDSLQTTEYLQQEAVRQEALRPGVPVPKRMIGVIIPREMMFWFLKLEGDVDAVAARENEVRAFVSSLRFKVVGNKKNAENKNDDPKDDEVLDWDLLAGWKQLPASEMRYATLILNGAPPLAMSVTQLPRQTDAELSDQVLSNVNRWRGQLSLGPVKKDDLDSETEKLKVDNSIAYWINMTGTGLSKSGSMAAPHGAMTPPHAASNAPARQAEPNGPTYDKPAEWEIAPQTAVSKVSLQARDGDAKVAITVTPARGNALDNVIRWRGQVHLNPITEDELTSMGKTVDVGKKSGNLYEISNEGRTILGVIVDDPAQPWFVKLDGDSRLAERERPRFEAFLKSLQLE